MTSSRSHDPSKCPRCRWAAEREGWTLKYVTEGGAGIQAYLDKDGRAHFEPPSFCTSLDAVAGLMKEMGKRDLGCLGYYNGSWCWFWPEEWPGPESEPEWWWKGMHGPEPIETDDYSCVIEAAMLVLRDKEKSNA